ncbi:CalY family protein [Siminovitchia fortis]|uniref:CalY family protein n=1 Tax=Siminovitchia fortis TaxID=254758 RepID=UPI0011A94407|nr:CalY family protein [Siminovitchia fortis]
MSIKKKLGMGVASAALGIALVGGGTFAYFSDVEATNNTFAAGTLDLAVNPTTIIDVSNLKPGDWMPRTFKLENNGSLDISKVLIETDYTVEGTDEDFGKHIKVNFLRNEDKSGVLLPSNVIVSKTLYELKTMSPDAVKNLSHSIFAEKSGLKAGTNDKLAVQFEFVDNGQDQNEFQGASLQLKWTFTAEQTKGEKR